MNSSDYILSLRALNLWLENLESTNVDTPDKDRENIIYQVNECFNNVFKQFSDLYESETGVKPPENLCETIIFSREDRGADRANTFRREVILPQNVINDISILVEDYEYTKLRQAFCEGVGGEKVYLNIEEAEALIELVIIEQKKALLKYPNYDKKLISYSQDDENKVLSVQRELYEKVIVGITDVFKEFDKECLI